MDIVDRDVEVVLLVNEDYGLELPCDEWCRVVNVQIRRSLLKDQFLLDLTCSGRICAGQGS